MDCSDFSEDSSSTAGDTEVEEEELLKQKASNHKVNSYDCYKHDSSIYEPEKSSLLSRLSKWNWQSISTFGCLWLAYLLCNMSYSIVGPFFPHEVELHLDNCGNTF